MTDFKIAALRDVGCEVFTKARKCNEQKQFLPWWVAFVPTIKDKVAAYIEKAEAQERHELSLEEARTKSRKPKPEKKDKRGKGKK